MCRSATPIIGLYAAALRDTPLRAERLDPMITLAFPESWAVGSMSWYLESNGSEPIMAIGSIAIPEGARVDLHISYVESILENAEGRVSYSGSRRPVDLRFLGSLPQNCVESLHLQSIIEPESIKSLPHLAPGLRRLYLAMTELGDEALESVCRLTDLTYLQTFGNNFTDSGVQVLAGLQGLESLYLEEGSLSAAAFAFADQIPRLKRLGLQDVPIGAEELADLRARLPDVEVG